MAFRLLRYQDRIWERWCADHPKAKTLPMIIPIVMYHGMTPWSEPRSFDALLDVPSGVRSAVEPYLVRFTYVLYDLSAIPDDELRASAMTALVKLVAMCFKHARRGEDFVQILGRWMDVAREVARAPNGLQALAPVMRYILEVNEHVAPEALQALLERDIGPEAKDIVVTAGQQLIEQGRKEGRQEGRQQGFQEVLLRQLRLRFGAQVDAQVEQRIMTASVEQIETWSIRVLSAATWPSCSPTDTWLPRPRMGALPPRPPKAAGCSAPAS